MFELKGEGDGDGNEGIQTLSLHHNEFSYVYPFVVLEFGASNLKIGHGEALYIVEIINLTSGKRFLPRQYIRSRGYSINCQ